MWIFVSVWLCGIIQGWSWAELDSEAQRRLRGQTSPQSSLPSSLGIARLSWRWSERLQDERREVHLRRIDDRDKSFSLICSPNFSLCFIKPNVLHHANSSNWRWNYKTDGETLRYAWHERNNKIKENKNKREQGEKKLRLSCQFIVSLRSVLHTSVPII